MNWPKPQFGYGQHVLIKPLDDAKARVVELHVLGGLNAVEYDVVYYHNGKQEKIRVLEDELENQP